MASPGAAGGVPRWLLLGPGLSCSAVPPRPTQKEGMGTLRPFLRASAGTGGTRGGSAAGPGGQGQLPGLLCCPSPPPPSVSHDRITNS